MLQPTLMLGDPNAYELGGDLAAVTHYVAQLRTTLIAKEDAQDELIVVDDDVIKVKPAAADDKDDKDDKDDDREPTANKSTRIAPRRGSAAPSATRIPSRAAEEDPA